MGIETLTILITGFAGVGSLLVAMAMLFGRIPPHVFLYCVTWTPCIVFSHVTFGAGIQPALTTTIILFAAWCAFLFGSLVPLTLVKPAFLDGHHKQELRNGIAVIYLLLGAQLAAVFFELGSFHSKGHVLNLSTILDDLVRMRLAGAAADIQLPPLLGTFRWAHVFYIPILIYMRSRHQISKFHLMVILLIAVASAGLHFTRAPLVQLSIVVLVSWMFSYRPPNRVILLVLAGAGVVLCVLFVLSQGAILEHDANAHIALSEALSSYFSTSPFAYQTIVLGDYPKEAGIYSLDALNFLLNKVGLIDSYPGLSRPYIYYPMVTNVYTYLDAFTLDFGVFGAIVSAMLVGLGCSSVYVGVLNRHTVGLMMLYAYLSYCCLMTPVNNEYIRMSVVVTAVVGWGVNRITIRSSRLVKRSRNLSLNGSTAYEYRS